LVSTSSTFSAGMRLAQPGDDGRQHLDADHLAGRDAHGAAHALAFALAAGGALQEAAVLSMASAWVRSASAASVGMQALPASA
jgi:hypothetical protein